MVCILLHSLVSILWSDEDGNSQFYRSGLSPEGAVVYQQKLTIRAEQTRYLGLSQMIDRLEQGQEAMQNIIDGALPMVEYVVRQKIPKLTAASPKQKESVCQWMFSSLIDIDSRIALEGYIEQLGRLLSVPIDALNLTSSNSACSAIALFGGAV